jgi:hypothetical protein
MRCTLLFVLLQWFYDHMFRLRSYVNARLCVEAPQNEDGAALSLQPCTDEMRQKWSTYSR